MGEIFLYIAVFILGMISQCIIAAVLQVYRERKQKQEEAQAHLQQLLIQILTKEKQNEKNL